MFLNTLSCQDCSKDRNFPKYFQQKMIEPRDQGAYPIFSTDQREQVRTLGLWLLDHTAIVQRSGKGQRCTCRTHETGDWEVRCVGQSGHHSRLPEHFCFPAASERRYRILQYLQCIQIHQTGKSYFTCIILATNSSGMLFNYCL